MRNNVIDTINQYQIAQMILSNLSDSLACIKDAIDNLSLRHMHDSEVVKKEASDFLSGVKCINKALELYPERQRKPSPLGEG